MLTKQTVVPDWLTRVIPPVGIVGVGGSGVGVGGSGVEVGRGVAVGGAARGEQARTAIRMVERARSNRVEWEIGLVVIPSLLKRMAALRTV
jgi:hypothetical protein